MQPLTLMVLALAFTCVASADTIFVIDSSQAVYEYSSDGTRTTFSMDTGTTLLGAAFDASGTLFAASRDSDAIVEYSPAGLQSVFVNVSSPDSLAVDSTGNVYTSPGNSGIVKYGPDGTGSVFATDVQPFSLLFDSAGNLYEGDNNGTIYKFTPDGTRTTFATGIGSAIFGLAFDATGNLYEADWGSEIVKIAPDGSTSVFASFSKDYLPTGLIYDAETGTLYMPEVANGVSVVGQQSVFAFSPSGEMTTFDTGLYEPYAIASLPGEGFAPEPGSLMLMAGGLLLVILIGRRRPVSRFLYPFGR